MLWVDERPALASFELHIEICVRVVVCVCRDVGCAHPQMCGEAGRHDKFIKGMAVFDSLTTP